MEFLQMAATHLDYYTIDFTSWSGNEPAKYNLVNRILVDAAIHRFYRTKANPGN